MEGPGTWEPLPASGAEDTRALRQLLDAAHAMHASLDLRETLDAIAHRVSEATGFNVVTINMIRAEGTYENVAVHGDEEARAQLFGVISSPETWRRLIDGSRRWRDLCFVHHDDPASSATDGEPVWQPEIEATDDPTRWHPEDMLMVPFTNSVGKRIGVLCVDAPANQMLPDAAQCEILVLFAHYASVAIERAMVHESLFAKSAELEWAATHDRLTGLRDRSIFEAEVPKLAGESGREIAVLVIDLDKFKQLNDTAGHQAGDDVLRTVAGRMRSAVRSGDLIARTGGDEFVVVAVGVNGAEAGAALRDRLRQAVEAPIRTTAGDFQVRVSIGMVSAATPADHQRLVAAADRAMYEEKQSKSGSSVPVEKRVR